MGPFTLNDTHANFYVKPSFTCSKSRESIINPRFEWWLNPREKKLLFTADYVSLVAVKAKELDIYIFFYFLSLLFLCLEDYYRHFLNR